MIGIVDITPIYGKYVVEEFGMMTLICDREELAQIIAEKILRQIDNYFCDHKDSKAVSLGISLWDEKPKVVEL